MSREPERPDPPHAPAVARDELAAGGDLFRQLIDTAPDAMVIVDESGRIVIVNGQVENLFGYTRRELLGQPIEILVPERFRSRHVGYRKGYSQKPATRGMGSGLELYGVRKNGQEFPVEISLSPLVTQDGILFSSAIRDISERKRVERAGKLSSDRLLSAVDSIQGMFALFDDEDKLVLCNSPCRELFMRGIEGPVVGRVYQDFLDANLKLELFDLGEESPSAFRERVLAYHAEPVGILPMRTRDKQSFRMAERRTLEGGVVTTIWDVTEDTRREDELRKAQELAEAASKAKSDFLSSMSHELRTPLNAILGFAQLLQRDKKTPLTERQQDRLRQVLKAGEHLLHLIDDILDLSRIESGRVAMSLEPVSLPEVLSEVKTTLRPMASRMTVQLSVALIADELAVVIADRTRLIQVLINFASNAIKYGKQGGKASFEVTRGSTGFARISVVDDGAGIAVDKQSNIFEPFQRAGQETGAIEGTGIGLAIARRLSDFMGGNLGFQSAPGEGSTFWIELPLPAPSASRASSRQVISPKAASPLASSKGPRYSIIYIEDNPSNVAFMEELVTELERVELVTAPTAEIGIELVRDRRPDVVLMDINLPGMSGYEATKRLQEWPETRDIPIVALSAAAMLGDRNHSKEAGFYRYLTKPVKVDELLSTLEELFAAKPTAT